jgi:Helix-turn-helix domain
MTMREGDEAFDWSVLVPRVVHPLKVAIVEGLLWVKEPLSATDFEKVLDGKFSLSLISYHLLTLQEAGALEVVRRRQVRGAVEKFYFFPTAG